MPILDADLVGVADLVVEDAEAEAAVPLGQLDHLGLARPHGQSSERL